MTLSSTLARAKARLETSDHLRANAARDALTLLLHTLGITRAQFHANPGCEITPQQQAACEAAIARRLTNEPVQYIIGEQEFYGLTLHVAPAVLIPRPETEHLVEVVLHELENATAPRILDVGTGSGAIAIALAHHLLHPRMTAVDISPAALALARENAARHGLGERIQFIESDLLSALAGQAFDAIVSNPPYVPEADRSVLHPQVREHEPSTALFAGPDGLAIYRRLIPQARAALIPGGLLALEIGHGQREAIADLLTSWSAVRFVDDLQGIPRVVLAHNGRGATL